MERKAYIVPESIAIGLSTEKSILTLSVDKSGGPVTDERAVGTSRETRPSGGGAGLWQDM